MVAVGRAAGEGVRAEVERAEEEREVVAAVVRVAGRAEVRAEEVKEDRAEPEEGRAEEREAAEQAEERGVAGERTRTSTIPLTRSRGPSFQHFQLP